MAKTDLTKESIQLKTYTENIYYKFRQLLSFTAERIIKMRFCNIIIVY